MAAAARRNDALENHIEGMVKAGSAGKRQLQLPPDFASALTMSMTGPLIPPIVSALEPGGTVVAA
jgi:hypothetical protein